MVFVAVRHAIVHAEALALGIVIMIDGLPFPALVAFDAKVVVALRSQPGHAVAGLQHALGQGNAGRYAAADHLLYGHIGILLHIALLRSVILGYHAYDAQEQKKSYENSLHSR